MLENRLFIYLFVQMWNKAMYVKSCFLTLTYDRKPMHLMTNQKRKINGSYCCKLNWKSNTCYDKCLVLPTLIYFYNRFK
jgi:hypothetical protein